jgi:hypothetical protein
MNALGYGRSVYAVRLDAENPLRRDVAAHGSPSALLPSGRAAERHPGKGRSRAVWAAYWAFVHSISDKGESRKVSRNAQGKGTGFYYSEVGRGRGEEDLQDREWALWYR